MAPNPRSGWGIGLTLLALAIIGWFTLRPSPADAEAAARVAWTCLFPCGDQALRDAILNVALFVPLGLAAALVLSPLRALLLSVLVTATVEFIQFRYLLGRDPSLRDLLTNTLGAGLGILLSTHWRTLLFPAPRPAACFTAVGGLGWLAALLATGILLRPSLPQSVYWGQWAPELGQFDTWRGQLLAAEVNGWPLPSGRLADSDHLRRLLEQDSVIVSARVILGPPTADIAPIVSVFDSEQREIFVLGQLGEGLVFRIRTGLRAAELGEQTLLLPRLPASGAGDTLLLQGGVAGRAWILAARGPAGGVVRRVPFSMGLLWSGLLPFRPLLGELAPVWSGLWLGVLLLPAAWWAGRAGAHGMAFGLGAVLALLLVSRVLGLPLPAPAEALGSLAGGVAGGWHGRRSRRWRA